MIANQLLAQPRCPLPLAKKFEGAGVYALYYQGPFGLYQALSNRNHAGDDVPIYVGEAVPAGSRKGGVGWHIPPGAAIHKRLSDHVKSLEAAENLSIGDFYCRYLAVDDVWISLGERMLIEMCSPIWNRVDGFGNHDPGKGRHKGKRPDWDVIHPGRAWASRLEPGRDQALIEAQIRSLLAKSIGA